MIRAGNLGRVRLTGEDLTALRSACFKRDDWRCSDCGRETTDMVPEWADSRAHMAHIEGRGRGGSDTLENVTTKCGACHGVEHHPKVIARKR